MEKVYRASNPRVIFTSAAVLNPKGRDLIFTSTRVAWFTVRMLLLKKLLWTNLEAFGNKNKRARS